MYREAKYKVGIANASPFYKEDMDARSFAHGDDFVTLGDDVAQAHLFGQLDKRYEYKRPGRGARTGAGGRHADQYPEPLHQVEDGHEPAAHR
eukprot:5843504-Heterocapsa_arctica.AAC.1